MVPVREEVEIPNTNIASRTANFVGEQTFGRQHEGQKIHLTAIPKVVEILKDEDNHSVTRWYSPPTAGMCRIGYEETEYYGLKELSYGGEAEMYVTISETHEAGEPVVFLGSGSKVDLVGNPPDWDRIVGSSLMPEFSDIIGYLDSLLGLIKTVENAQDSFIELLDQLQNKVDLLQKYIKAVEKSLDRLLDIFARGLVGYSIIIETNEGMAGFAEELRNAENKPDYPNGWYVAGFVILTGFPAPDEEDWMELKGLLKPEDKPIDTPPALKEYMDAPDKYFDGKFEAIKKLFNIS